MKRDFLQYPDIGFAVLPEYFGRGYAYQSSIMLLNLARDEFLLTAVSAFTGLDNIVSQNLLAKLGFHFQGDFEHPTERTMLKSYQRRL